MAEAKAEAAPAKKMDPKFIGILLFAVINIAVMGGATFLIFKNTLGWNPPVVRESDLRKLLDEHHKAIDQSAEAGQNKADNTVPPSLVLPSFDELQIKLDPFTANLDGEPRRMIKIGLTLKVLDEKSYEEVLDPARFPRVKDSVLSVLQKTQFSDIESLQGKLFLKDRILKEINPLLVQGVVREVYFNELVVQ